MKKKIFVIMQVALCVSTKIAVAQSLTFSGDTARFDAIISQMEDNIPQNYYTNSLRTTHVSKYVYADSTKELLMVAYGEGVFNEPLWTRDEIYYSKNSLVLSNDYKNVPYHHLAQSYMSPAAPPCVDMLMRLSSGNVSNILTHFLNKRGIAKDKGMAPSRTDYLLYSCNFHHIRYVVTDTVYESQACYKLSSFTTKNDNGIITYEYIINKQDYALLYFYCSNEKEFTEQTYARVDSVYQLTKSVSNDMAVSKTSCGKAAYVYSVVEDCGSPKQLGNTRRGWEEAVAVADVPSPQMLEEWNNFLGKR